MSSRITVNFLRWRAAVHELRRRGRGTRESGAFLLGTRQDGVARIRSFAYYDDLDPHALDRGHVAFSSAGYSALWAVCREAKLDVIGDVHTHPGTSTRQSESDRTNPMIAEPGHLALILPDFARLPWWTFAHASLYEYRGSYKWMDRSKALSQSLALTLF